MFAHPFIAANELHNFAHECGLPELDDVADLIAGHMGQWNTNKNAVFELPKPSDEAQKFVHMCDYLASRKYLTVEVE